MLPSLEEPLQLRVNLRLTPNTPSGLWPAPASGRKRPTGRGRETTRIHRCPPCEAADQSRLSLGGLPPQPYLGDEARDEENRCDNVSGDHSRNRRVVVAN